MSGNEVIPRPTRDAEDMAAALLPKQRQSGSQYSDHPEIVRVEQSANLLVAGLLSRRKQSGAGIVDKNVDPTEVRVRLLNDLLHLLGVGHIEGQGKDSFAEASCEISYIRQFAGGCGDSVAALQSSFSPDPTEAARSAGDKPCFFHLDSPCSWKCLLTRATNTRSFPRPESRTDSVDSGPE